MSEWPLPSSCVSTPMECCYSTLDIPDIHCSTSNGPSLSQGVLTHLLSSQIPVPPLVNLKSPPSSLFTPSFIYLWLSTCSETITWIFMLLCLKSSNFSVIASGYSKGNMTSPFELFCIKLAFSLLCLRTLVNMHTCIYIIYISKPKRHGLTAFNACRC